MPARRFILGLYIVFLMVPIYWLVNMSLKTNNEISNTMNLWPHTFTLANYIKIFTDESWYSGYINSLKYVFINMVISIGFAGDQVDRDGIAGEGVHEEEVEVLGWFAFEGETAVAEDCGDCSGSFSEEGEVIAGDVEDLGIDLVETVIVFFAGVTEKRAAAETENADLVRDAFLARQ